jgi:hypothetical protein
MVYKIILTKEHKISATNIGHDPFASFLFCFDNTKSGQSKDYFDTFGLSIQHLAVKSKSGESERQKGRRKGPLTLKELMCSLMRQASYFLI